MPSLNTLGSGKSKFVDNLSDLNLAVWSDVRSVRSLFIIRVIPKTPLLFRVHNGNELFPKKNLCGPIISGNTFSLRIPCTMVL